MSSIFKSKGMNVVGVDPAKGIAKKATDDGIETIANFFSYELAQDLLKKYGPAKYITSHNACAHIDNLADVVKGVELWLDLRGVFVLKWVTWWMFIVILGSIRSIMNILTIIL